MLTEAVIHLVDIHDRLVTSLVYCAISHWYYRGLLVVVVDFLYCLVCLREILLHKKNQNMEEIQGGHCPCSKIQGGQPTTLSPPCRAPAHNRLCFTCNGQQKHQKRSPANHVLYQHIALNARLVRLPLVSC